MTPIISGHFMAVDPDWSVLELDGVMSMVAKVAKRISRDDMPMLSADDLEQEAFIILATRAEAVLSYYEQGGVRHLGSWLRQRLLDKARTEMDRADKQTSYEGAREGADPDRV